MTNYKKFFFLLILILTQGACATYHFGKGERTFPGGYDRVAIPMFVNKTKEVGVETSFTQWLRYEFDRSKLAKLSSEVAAQVIIEGTVIRILYTPTIQITPNSATVTNLYTPHCVDSTAGCEGATNLDPLPTTAVLNTQYLVQVDVHIDARKASDHTVLWSSDFSSQRQYAAPLLGKPTTVSTTPGIPGTPGINTAAPLYNQVSRTDTISLMARDMMSEAHDRLTENF